MARLGIGVAPVGTATGVEALCLGICVEEGCFRATGDGGLGGATSVEEATGCVEVLRFLGATGMASTGDPLSVLSWAPTMSSLTLGACCSVPPPPTSLGNSCMRM